LYSTGLGSDHIIIEMPEDQGRSDDSLFETAFWAGRFIQYHEHYGRLWSKIYRHEVKLHLCKTVTVGDKEVRAALIQRFGKEVTKEMRYDVWSAFALAVTFADHCRLIYR